MDTPEVQSSIKMYFTMGLRLIEILHFLALRHEVYMSTRQLKRILQKMKLYRRKHYSDLSDVYDFIQNEVSGSGQLHGYRWMHLKCIQNGFVVTQETVRLMLQQLDPAGVCHRKRGRLRRRQYYNKGPNYLWHVDGYDKLKPYGIAISGCIDGFSRFVIWLKAGYTNNDPRVIAGYYVNTIKHYTNHLCPRTLRTDFGTENKYIEHMQSLLRDNLQENHCLPPFLYGSSNHNQRIEAWWAILRKEKTQYWINLFEELKDGGHFDGSFVHKSLIQFCFLSLIQAELDEIVFQWNSHKISKSRNSRSPTGKPFILYNLPEMYNSVDYGIKVPDEELSACEEQCVFADGAPRDRDVAGLCKILMTENNFAQPKTEIEAVSLYINLKIRVENLLKD